MCIRDSLWIDGEEVAGAQESLIASHRFVMPKGLSAGKDVYKRQVVLFFAINQSLIKQFRQMLAATEVDMRIIVIG